MQDETTEENATEVKAPELQRYVSEARKPEPVDYEVIDSLAEGGPRSLRFHARGLTVFESDALDQRFFGEPWFETLDGGGVNGPSGVTANRERLKVVLESVDNVEGAEGALSGKALTVFLDDPANSEVVYLGWVAYKALTGIERHLFRRIRDPRAGTGGDAGAARGSAASGRSTA
jgi:hypothetical protein